MGKFLGKFIKTIRQDAGVSQAELAKAMGLKTAQSVSNIERGISPLPPRKIKVLAKTVRLHPEWIVDRMVIEYRETTNKKAKITTRP
jgi:transcriptional regulator with XRE-family HTH domain